MPPVTETTPRLDELLAAHGAARYADPETLRRLSTQGESTTLIAPPARVDDVANASATSSSP